jgi:hypothetical protein
LPIRWVHWVHSGFQTPAFQELGRLKFDQNYDDANLIIGGMSIKALVQFDSELGKYFGLLDFGGSNSTGEDVPANEALVAMVVGLKCFSKPPIAFF